MTFEILEPVRNDKGELCWLVNEGNQPISSNLKNKSIKKIVEENKPIKYKTIFGLKSEGLWQCRRCKTTIQSSPNKPLECPPTDQGGCGRSSDFDSITDIIKDDIENLWKIPIWKDIPQEDINILDVYHNLNELTTKCIIFPEVIFYKIYNLWIISTYHNGIWETVGWPLFIGLPDSGKTRALDFISEIGYRMVHGGSGISFPAMVRASHYYGAGILIDQADSKFNEHTETGREMRDFICPSYRRRSKYVVAHKEDQKKVIAYNSFGFKALGTIRGLDWQITSRCIPFLMERDFPDIQKLSSIQNDLDIIQTQLLNYKYKFDPPSDLKQDIGIKGRIREIFESIIATGKHIGIDVSDIIKFAQDMEKEKEEELVGTIEWEILKAIKGSEENEKLFDAPEEISFKDICFSIGWEYDGKTSQKLGYIFNKKLLLKTKHKTHGTILLLNEPKNDRRLKYLYTRYKV